MLDVGGVIDCRGPTPCCPSCDLTPTRLDRNITQEAFNDVTTGASSGCFLGPGWPAAPGWDAVTGVGTPNYAKLAKVVAALP